MNQNQQSQEFKCKDHTDKPVLFWCKSSDCNDNRLFSLNCQKQKKHVKHYNEDLFSTHELNQFLIDKSKQPKGLISECLLQFQSTVKPYDKLISGLSYKFCGLEDKINQLLDSLISFDEFKNHLKTMFWDFYRNFRKQQMIFLFNQNYI